MKYAKNKLRIKLGFFLHAYIEMHGQQNTKFSDICLSDFDHFLFLRQILIEVPNIKFYEIPPSDTRTDRCGKIDGRTQQR